jgi:hypothetical protein
VESVRLDLESSPGCPGSERFEALVRARTRRAVFVRSGPGARSIEVRMHDGPHPSGSLVLRRGETIEGTRSVSAETCADVAEALALVVTLAIDPEAASELGATDTGVFKVPAAGGQPVQLASGAANDIVVSGGRVFYTGVGSGDGSEGLLSVPVHGGAPTVLVPPDPNYSVETLTVDCVNVYYSTTNGMVAQIPIGGGTPTILAKDAQQAMQIAVDAERVYFMSGTGIASVPIGGGAETLITSSGGIGLAVDANNVYWTSMNDGSVMKMAK